MSAPTFIQEEPPRDGKQYDCQCARCGGEMEWSMCGACGGDGFTEPGDLHSMDPLFYDRDDVAPCHECDGKGGYGYVCCNSAAWCEANPLPAREKVERNTPEWFEDQQYAQPMPEDGQ